MKIRFAFVSGKYSNKIRFLLCACMMAGLFLVLHNSAAYAVQDLSPGVALEAEEELACTPPNDWAQTTRLKNPEHPSKQWAFTVDEPQMDVSLIFFYYQDYTKAGCPYTCGSGDCQADETGKGESPLGGFNVLDGKLGGNRGVKKLEGLLAKGTYQVTFTANGDPGSLNVGLVVRQESVPTATTSPTNTPAPTAIIPTATNTPPPVESPTPTKPTRTPPATLAPPTPFPGSPPPQALIPQTGIGDGLAFGVKMWLIIPFGIGMLGLGIAFYGIATRLKRE